jgi:metal transporter CNNM
MHGALSFSDKTVADIMTPREKVYALAHNRMLTSDTLEEIRENGFSRVPVYGESIDKVLGILYVLKLVGKEGLALQSVESVTLREPHTVYADEKLDVVLKRFLHSKRHLRIVKDRKGKTVGVVTLEDILEEVIRSEIEDERDEG